MGARGVMIALVEARAAAEALIVSIPEERFGVVPEGHAHSPKDVVAHLVAYEDLIVSRLRAARQGGTTAFDRDRVGWEAFNDRVWAEAAGTPAEDVRRSWRATGEDLLREVGRLTDEDAEGTSDLASRIDPAWLDGHTPAEMIAMDATDHYEMHRALLEAAAR